MVTVLILFGIIIVLLIMLIAGCYVWISGYAARFIFRDSGVIPFRKTALVLGTAKLTPKGGENLYFRFRIDAAAQLFQQQKCNKLIVSGANPLSRSFTEADEMMAALVDRGIPADAVIVDRAGYRTWDSLWRCKGSFGDHTIVAVSQKFHVERAIFTGNKQGLDVIGFTAQEVKGSIALKMFLRECLARVKCILDCYILRPKPVYMQKMRRRRKRRR